MTKTYSFFKRLSYAAHGLAYIIKHDRHILLHLIIGFMVILFSFVSNINLIEWCLILSAIFLVIFSEIINSIVESLCDLIDSNYNSKVGIIKDISAGAVLFISLYATIIGIIIFYPKCNQILKDVI